jgi:hypothetical protein
MKIHIGHYGMVSIQDDPALQARVDALRVRISGNARNRPIGKQIAAAFVQWEMDVRAAVESIHGPELQEYTSYPMEHVPLEALEHAEQLNAAGKAQAQAQGPTYQCAMQGCQRRVLTRGTYCARCQHDED